MKKWGILILTIFSSLVSPHPGQSKQQGQTHSLHAIVFLSYLIQPPSAEKIFDAADLPDKVFPEKFSQLFAPFPRPQTIELPAGVALPTAPMFLDVYTYRISEKQIQKQQSLSRYNDLSQIDYRIKFLFWSKDGYQIELEGHNEDFKFNHVLVNGAADKTTIVRIRRSASCILYFVLTPDITSSPMSIMDQLVNDMTHPVLISQPLPPYPSELSKARREGLVRIRAIVTKNGSIDRERFILIECPHYLFARNCLDTILNNWTFKPGTKKGVPVDIWADIEVSFRI